MYIIPPLATSTNKQCHCRVVKAREVERLAKWADKCRKYQRMSDDNRPPRAPPRPAFADYYDQGPFNPDRFKCVVGLPWLDCTRQVTEWGIGCKGCRIPSGNFIVGMTDEQREEYNKKEMKQQMLYSEEEYVDHFTRCRESMDVLTDKKDKLLGSVIHICPTQLCKVAGDSTAADPKWAEIFSTFPFMRELDSRMCK